MNAAPVQWPPTSTSTALTTALKHQPQNALEQVHYNAPKVMMGQGEERRKADQSSELDNSNNNRVTKRAWAFFACQVFQSAR